MSIPNIYLFDKLIKSEKMDFSSWMMEKFKEWEQDQPRGRSSFTAFARYLGVKQPSLTRWMAGDNPPDAGNIQKLSEKLGPEIYEILGFARPSIPSITIPLLGRIAAGEPIPLPPSDLAYFDSESKITAYREWLPRNTDFSELYALELEGESLIEIGVFSGDTVIIKKAITADNGDLVAVRIDEENSMTLKRIYRENGHVRLQPANKEMNPLVLPADKVHVMGKVLVSIHKWF